MIKNCNSNHISMSLITKGILGGSLGLATKGVLSNAVQIIVTTVKGKKGGSSAFGAYDKDYWKRFRRDLEEDDDEIKLIEVKIRKRFLPHKYNISVRLLKPIIEAELIEMDLIDEKNVPEIRIEFIEPNQESKVQTPKSIKIELMNEGSVDDSDDDPDPSIDVELL